jgi:hypothetical protein
VLGLHGDGCRRIGRPELEEIALFKALVRSRLDVEGDELDTGPSTTTPTPTYE